MCSRSAPGAMPGRYAPLALALAAATFCAPQAWSDEVLRVPLPELGAPVLLDLELAEYTVRGLRVSRAGGEAEKPAYAVAVGVTNPGVVPVAPALTMSLWAGRQWLATVSFGDTAVPPRQLLTLTQRVAAGTAAAPDTVALYLPTTDWAEWRGPDRNGVAPYSLRLAASWPDAGPRQLWDNHEFPVTPHQYAGGHSCPAIADGRVYLYIHDIGVPRDVVACLDLATGSVLWRTDIPGQATWHGGSGTPCVVGDRVYVAGARFAYCLNARTGAVLWSRDLQAPPEAGQEVSSSFAVVANVAVVAAGPMLGLDVRNGNTLWEAPSSGGYSMVMTSMVPWRHQRREYGVYVGVDRLTCIDPADGKVVWDVPGTPVWVGTAPSPAVTGDYMAVYFQGEMQAYRLTLAGPERLWTAPFFEEYSSPIVWRGHVYTVGPNQGGEQPTVRCRELLTGKVLWDVPVSTPEYSSPVLADGKLLVLTDRGSVLRMIDAVSGQMLATTFVGAQLWSSPSIADGKVLLRTADGVACYDLAAADALPAKALPETDRYLELVEATKNVCGWGAARDRASVIGTPLLLGGKTFHRGIGTHAACEMVFPLAGKYHWLTFYAGIGGHVTETGSVVIEVWLDGEKAYTSPILRANEDPVYVSLPVSGVQQLHLVGSDAGDGLAYDNINFGNLRVSTSETEPPPDGP